MSDKFGALPIPVAAVGSTALGDPLISYTADFFKAVLNARAAIAPFTTPVRATFTNDPTRTAFKTTELPALFVWRLPSSGQDQAADDIRLDVSQVMVMWVFPALAPQEIQSSRESYANAIVKTLSRAVYLNRDPAWKVAGDTDPKAATLGSDFAKWAGYWRFQHASARVLDLQREMAPGVPPMQFAAVETRWNVEEPTTWDVESHGDPLGGLDASFRVDGLEVDHLTITLDD